MLFLYMPLILSLCCRVQGVAVIVGDALLFAYEYLQAVQSGAV